jgi:hypothetical protein
MLEEGVVDPCHERMTVKALPRPSFEVIKAEFFFQLLMGLLADPPRRDGGSQSAQLRLGGQVGEIVFLPPTSGVHRSARPPLPEGAADPCPDPLRRSVGDPHTDSGKAGFELSFRAGSPTDVLPLGLSQHVFGRHR